jgi:hypothetical protein
MIEQANLKAFAVTSTLTSNKVVEVSVYLSER